MSAETGSPEFHIVVKRPSRKGPIGPYKFAISLLVAIGAVFGDARSALATGAIGDAVLLRAVQAGVFAWIVLSVLNRVLRTPAGSSPGQPGTDAAA